MAGALLYRRRSGFYRCTGHQVAGLLLSVMIGERPAMSRMVRPAHQDQVMNS